MKVHPSLRRKANSSPQGGYVLIVMLLFLALMAIGLTAMAPAIAQRVRREREIELIHRGRQYAHAIRLFYRKFGRYPVRLEELENTNNVRFLRRRYKDPMTPDGEWRLIHYGEAQFNLPNAGPLLPGAAAPGTTGSVSSPFANTFSGSAQGSPGQASATPAGTTTQGQTGTTPDQSSPTAQTATTPGGSADSSQSGQASGQPGQPATPASQLSSPLGGGPTFGGGPVVGVASKSKKESIKVLNKKNHYNEWEFVYNPQLDLTTAQAVTAVAGQNPLAAGTQTPGASTIGGPAFGTQPATPTTPSPGMPGTQPTPPAQQ